MTTHFLSFAKPLPGPPQSEMENPIVAATIHNIPDLFALVKIHQREPFESLLNDHPNQPFVNSVLKGLWEGFWPCADNQSGSYPQTHEYPSRKPKDEAERLFIKSRNIREPFSPRALATRS